MSRQKEQAKFWIDHDIDNLELLKATYFKHTFTTHFHDEYAIGVTLSGAQDTKYQHQHQYMPAGTICVINPGELHTGFAHDLNIGWTYRMFYPSVSMLQEVAEQLNKTSTRPIFFPNLVIENTELFQQMLFTHLRFENKTTSKLERDVLLFNMLYKLIIQHSDDTQPVPTQLTHPTYLEQAKDFIDAHYYEDITLQQIADAVHISRYHLLRMFQIHFRVSPHVYLTHRRITEAKQLLLLGYPLADIAQQTGFTDQSHFTHRFKQITGITPKQYV